MPNYRTQIVSPKSPEEVFAYMADFSNAAEWDPGVASAVRKGSGDVTVGEAFELEVRTGPTTMPMTYEVIELEAPTRVVFRSETSRLVSLDTITVNSTPQGTTLGYDADLRFKGIFGLANPLLALAFQRIGDKATAGLRKHLA